MDIRLAATMEMCSGVAHIQDLLDSGYTRHQVARLHRTGELVRPRIGWYVSPTLDSAVVRAVRAGGVLDCISAARTYGLPAPDDHRVHVGLPSNAARLRSTQNGFQRVAAGEDPGIVRHWGPIDNHRRHRVELVDCLSTAVGCVSREWAVAMIDAALHGAREHRRAPLTEHETTKLRESLSLRQATILDRCSAKSESFLESIVRQRLHDAGLHPEEQVTVGSYRVDFLLDGWLVIECDGRAHSEAERFAGDRVRDAYMAERGLRVLRFTYRQIMDDWLAVLRAIHTVLLQGRPRPR